MCHVVQPVCKNMKGENKKNKTGNYITLMTLCQGQ